MKKEISKTCPGYIADIIPSVLFHVNTCTCDFYRHKYCHTIQSFSFHVMFYNLHSRVRLFATDIITAKTLGAIFTVVYTFIYKTWLYSLTFLVYHQKILLYAKYFALLFLEINFIVMLQSRVLFQIYLYIVLKLIVSVHPDFLLDQQKFQS